ncbi:uncharacterized protein LOC132792184 [Drosophila nasuta]|uniref:uncharacterized protein LOC132792184 n=1 Tax=Drosophila nasuta TaxID=42062 RepID=UPI00295EA8D1|nr:uncharacterized protein LOC132792184 [Drosophila nasuta]
MALIYYDKTIKTFYELILSGLKETSRPTSIHELVNYVTVKTDFPGSVCYQVIRKALDKGLACKTIRQLGDLYMAIPSNIEITSSMLKHLNR